MKTLSFLLMFIFTGLAHGATLSVTATFSVSAEYEEIDEKLVKKEGWLKQVADDETIYVLKINVPLEKAKLNKSVGKASFSINPNGVVTLGMEVGDSDASTTTTIQLPLIDGKIAPFPGVMTIENSGGDHASGAWSFSGKLELKVIP